MMDQFQVWRFNFADKGGEHVLFCTSQRQSRQPKPTEVLLDTSDGMDWESFCDCSLIYAVRSDQLYGQRGVVSLERRRAIRGLLREMFLLNATD